MSIGVQIFACQMTTDFATDHFWRKAGIHQQLLHSNSADSCLVSSRSALEIFPFWQTATGFDTHCVASGCPMRVASTIAAVNTLSAPSGVSVLVYLRPVTVAP
jgi:hypothetical protein